MTGFNLTVEKRTIKANKMVLGMWDVYLDNVLVGQVDSGRDTEDGPIRYGATAMDADHKGAHSFGPFAFDRIGFAEAVATVLMHHQKPV